MLQPAEFQPCLTGNQAGGCNTKKHMQFELQILNSCRQRKSNSYTHIVGIHQHDETTVDTLRRWGDW